MEGFNKFFARTIVDQFSVLLDQRKYRECIRALRERFGANDDQTVIDAFVDVMKNLKFIPNNMDFSDFMNIFDILVEILSGVNQDVSQSMRLHYLKNCMSTCGGKMFGLRTLYDDLKKNLVGVNLTYDLYVNKLKVLYNDLMIAKRKSEYDQASEQSKNAKKASAAVVINAVESQYSSSSYYDKNSGGRGNGGGRNPGAGRGKGRGGRGKGSGKDQSYYGPSNQESVSSIDESTNKYPHITCYICQKTGHYSNKRPMKDGKADSSSGSIDSVSSNVTLSEAFERHHARPNSGRGNGVRGRGN